MELSTSEQICVNVKFINNYSKNKMGAMERNILKQILSAYFAIVVNTINKLSM